jgi:hypothetical protein
MTTLFRNALRLAAPPALLFALVAGPADAQALPRCDFDRHVNHLIHASRGEQTITLGRGGCRIEARIRGEATYTPDFRGIAALSAGGSFRLEEEDGSARRRLELSDDGRGGIDADYRVGRDTRPFDADAQAWLADRLLLLYRRSGLAAEARAEWLYRTGGINALLGELEHVESSSAHSALMTHALRHPELSDAAVARLLRSGLPSSSSARVRILLAVADRGPLAGEVGEAYLEAVGATSSSSSQRQALERALRDGQAPRPFLVGALRTTGRISSSSTRSALLALMAAEYRFDDAVLGAYLDAVAGTSSSSGKRDALTAVLTRQELDTAQLARVLRAVGRISSSSAQGDILVQVAASRPLAGDARVAYVDVASSISSSSQRARVLEALERGPSVR